MNDILSIINGIDPHQPVFEPDRCYLWTLESSVRRFTDSLGNTQLFIQAPRHAPSACVRKVLYEHFMGTLLPKPITSARSPCPTHPNRPYGHCCFPTIRMTCHSALCVNPWHMKPCSADQRDRECSKYWSSTRRTTTLTQLSPTLTLRPETWK